MSRTKRKATSDQFQVRTPADVLLILGTVLNEIPDVSPERVSSTAAIAQVWLDCWRACDPATRETTERSHDGLVAAVRAAQ